MCINSFNPYNKETDNFVTPILRMRPQRPIQMKEQVGVLMVEPGSNGRDRTQSSSRAHALKHYADQSFPNASEFSKKAIVTGEIQRTNHKDRKVSFMFNIQRKLKNSQGKFLPFENLSGSGTQPHGHYQWPLYM